MNTVPIHLQGTPSHVGLSYYLGLDACPKRMELGPLLRETESSFDRLSAANVGIYTHALLEAYDEGRLRAVDNPEFTKPDGVVMANDDTIEAIRLWRWWARQYMPNHFGELIGCEFPLAAPESLCGFLGVKPDVGITGRADQIVRVTTAAADRLGVQHNLDLAPGVYIVDHKTRSRDSGFAQTLDSLQFILYPMLWDAMHPEDKCEGVLANFIVRTKMPKNVLLWKPARTPRRASHNTAFARCSRRGYANEYDSHGV
jgi:hypothetical protein